MPEPEDARFLEGFSVLVTRPAHQAAGLCEMIESAGGVALRLPLLAIAKVADPAAASTRLDACRDWDRWIFSSANAVHYAAALAAKPWPPVAAVGAVTAAALRALGHADVLAPEQGDGGAALLAHPLFREVSGRRLLLIAGENPMPELETALVARGATVELIAVYRRVPIGHSEDEVAGLLARADFAVVSSAEALMQLARLTPPAAQNRLRALQLVVPSRRVVEKARELGFARTPLLPQRVTDAAYLDVLRRHLND